MINKEELNSIMTKAKLTILERIKKLSEVVDLFDVIEVDADSKVSDEYLIALIRNQHEYRLSLAALEEDWLEEEEIYWEELLNIDQDKEKES